MQAGEFGCVPLITAPLITAPLIIPPATYRPPTGHQQDAVTYQRMLDTLPESEVGLARELCLEAMANGHYQACKKWLG